MFRLSKDVYASVFLLAFSVIMYVSSFSIKMLTVSKIGAGFMPRMIAIAIFILSIILLINSIKEMKFAKQRTDILEDEDEDEHEGIKRKISPLSVVITLALMIGYIALLKPVGFLIMSSIYLFLQMYLLADPKERKAPLFIIVSVVSSVVIYFCFKSIFHLMLPAGILG
ncbi:tripartite tricarboxylate transporter TctB family protein [Alkalihalobacillus deserti]|uniref:tripartite tricarboxylate transporter TctB family protein n=1 Tax=Alkalihalobacillus deserti TaxID=2879466 RepID=UPI001D15A0DD|nr:tripartite tricarboxylate transporter TctB family protein [Alkalihalobacillus deserti]